MECRIRCGPRKDYEQAKLVSISAWASMAAYDDKTGTLAQEELRSNHWKIDAIHYKTPHSDINTRHFKKRRPKWR